MPPPLGGGRLAPGVERVGRGPRGVAVGVRPGRQQPGCRGDLDQERRGRLVELQGVGGGLQVADSDGSGPQCHRRPGAPVVDDQLHPAYHLEGGAGGRAVHEVGGAFGGRHLGRHVDRLARRVAATQGDLDLAGHPDQPGPAGNQQAAGEQLFGRRRRLGGRDLVSRRPGVGLARARLDVLEQGAGGGRELVEHPRRLLGGAASAHRVQLRQRAERVRHAGQRSETRVVLPDQGQVDAVGARRSRQRTARRRG